MLTVEQINLLFNNVLNYDIVKYNIPDKAVKHGIETMQSVYAKENKSLSSGSLSLADYNDPAHRCAYLHKYAALHTAMVRDMMYTAVQMNYNFFYEIVFSSNPFTICCLGGGPGTDVVGVLAALHESFSFFPTTVTIVDYMTNWRISFLSILRELGSGFYGAFGNNAYHFLDWSYLGADLLQKTMDPDVYYSLSQSSLVTMIKFASAASCIDTSKMIDNIFTSMKPGAVLLFVDNDAGGYHELIAKGAEKHGFISILGPIRHENYCNDGVKVKRFGYTSCHRTTVTVHVLQKPVYFNNPVNYDSPIVSCRPVLKEVLPMFQTPYSPTMPVFTMHFTPDNLLGRFDYTTDEPIGDTNEFISPSVEMPQSCKKKKKLGCLPLKRWRNNLCKKINIVKSSLRLRKNRVKKTHPIFRL